MSMIVSHLFSFRGKVERFLSEQPSLVFLLAILTFIPMYINGLRFFWIVFVLGVVLTSRCFWRQYLPAVLLGYMALFFYLGEIRVNRPTLGQAWLHIEEVALSSSSFGEHWVYQGIIKEFRPHEGAIGRRLPFKMYLSKKYPHRPIANQDYWVEAELIKSDFYGYKLKVKKDGIFERVSRTYSFAEYRYTLKSRFKRFVQKSIPFKKAQIVLLGMSTGNLNDSFLSYTFSRFGLNHLLAISGFHFSLLAVFASLLLRYVPHKMKLIFLALILSAFYLFVGDGPSLKRAWIVAMLYLWCLFRQRMVTSINVLSLSMILILLINPFMIYHLGFQFSFFVTFAILLYTRPCYLVLKRFFRPVVKIETLVVKAFSLGLAVHIAALPLCLYHFHKFYFSGLLLNLIVPAYFSMVLFGFMAMLLLYFIFPMGAGYGLYAIGFLTEKCVDILYGLPTSLDYCLRVPTFPSLLLQMIILIFFFGGCFVNQKNYLLNLNPNSLTPSIEN